MLRQARSSGRHHSPPAHAGQGRFTRVRPRRKSACLAKERCAIVRALSYAAIRHRTRGNGECRRRCFQAPDAESRPAPGAPRLRTRRAQSRRARPGERSRRGRAGGVAHDALAASCSTILRSRSSSNSWGRSEESLRLHRSARSSAARSSSPATRRCSPSTGRRSSMPRRAHKVPVFFEAAVAGGIPIIKAIREAFIGNHIQSIHGIINGTSNYILTRMTESGLGFAEALAEAQAAGYAEADPTLDVNGWDAAHKAIILASLAYGFWIARRQDLRRRHRRHHRQRHPLRDEARLLDQAARHHQGRRARRDRGARASRRSSPKSTCSRASTASSTRSRSKATSSASTLFYGRGAGQDPTSSAVIADIAEAAHALQSPRRNYGFMPHGLYGTCKPLDEIVSRVLPARLGRRSPRRHRAGRRHPRRAEHRHLLDVPARGQ